MGTEKVQHEYGADEIQILEGRQETPWHVYW